MAAFHPRLSGPVFPVSLFHARPRNGYLLRVKLNSGLRPRPTNLGPDLQNMLRLSYDNATVTIDLRRTSILPNL